MRTIISKFDNFVDCGGGDSDQLDDLFESVNTMSCDEFVASLPYPHKDAVAFYNYYHNKNENSINE